MAANGMSLRSGKFVGLPPPAPAPAPPPPAPIPAAQNTLIGLPQVLRTAILQAVFQGQPRMDLEGLLRPGDLASLCSVGNHQLKYEVTQAFFTVGRFEITILASMEDSGFIEQRVDWGQPPSPFAPVGNNRYYTFQEFRNRVRRAQPLVPSQASLSWSLAAFIRIIAANLTSDPNFEKHRARSAGEFPWNTCNQWVKDACAVPLLRDVEFKIIEPLRAYMPLVHHHHHHQLAWDYPVSGLWSFQVLPGARAIMVTQSVGPTFPPPPVPNGILMPPPRPPVLQYDYAATNTAGWTGQYQRADIEARRIRQSYLPAVPPPGAPGFTGFTLRDLRSIAKSFSEPSIYTIRD